MVMATLLIGIYLEHVIVWIVLDMVTNLNMLIATVKENGMKLIGIGMVTVDMP